MDLSTRYLGLALRSPVVASCGPLTGKLDTLAELDDAGVGAVVLPSLFEEQLTHEQLEIDAMLSQSAEGFGEAMSFFPDLSDYNTGPDRYLDLVADAKERLSCPVIASLNGTTEGGWVRYAKLLEEAGADAIELNIYLVAADAEATSEEVEARYTDLVAAVRPEIAVPLAVKVGPQFTSIPASMQRIVAAGADGLVLFNRFYQPDIDLETLEVTPNLVLSSSEEMRLPMRWIAILYGRIQASLALTSGVHTSEDLAKALLAGADVAMTTSAVLKHGAAHVGVLLRELEHWMAEEEYESVTQLKGSVSQEATADPAAFERANYIETLSSYTTPFRA
ncbi:MAG: dihydroorotate dehydrogenase-like protein [Actinomycetota bacterium]